MAANYAGKIWSIAAIYLFVPLYIKYLGIEAYGVIAFHSVLLGILFIADAGLSSAFAREVAKGNHNEAGLATLLRSLEGAYLVILFMIACGVGLASGWIANSWLKPSQEVPALILQTSIILMAATAAIQVAMSLYNGGLMGAEYHTIANSFQIAFSMARSGLVILPLYFYPSLVVYFSWQLLVCVFFLFWMRRTVWHKLELSSSAKFSIEALRNISKFALGMLGVAVISALITQLDKLVLSKMLSLQDLARYTVAGMLAQVPSIITLPIAVSLLPRLTRWVNERQTDVLVSLYQRFSYVIASIAATAGLIVALNPEQLIALWTGSSNLSSGLDMTVRILVAGHVMLALQYMPYYLSIANGHTRTNMIIGMAFLLVTPFILIVLIREFGITGAAVPWLLMNTCATILLATVLTRRFLNGQLRQWWINGFGAPLVITSICAGSINLGWSTLNIGPEFWMWKIIVLAALCSLSSLAGYFILFQRMRLF